MLQINVVMIEPEIPQNTGNIARTCAATGAHLHLVKPLGFDISDKKLKRAGLDYWHMLNISYYQNINEFFFLNKKQKFFFSTKANKTYTEVKYPAECFLVFGKETKGLPEELLVNNPDTTVRIPMQANSRSLNLSNSVAIAVYEVLRQYGFPDLQSKGSLRNYNW